MADIVGAQLAAMSRLKLSILAALAGPTVVICVLAGPARAGAELVRSFIDDEAANAGVSAEILATPANVSSADFANRLAAQEDAPAWARLRSGGQDGPVPTVQIMVLTNDHRTVSVFFRAREPAGQPGRVCRVDFGKQAIGEVHRRAYRWCFDELGSSPIVPQQPIIPPVQN